MKQLIKMLDEYKLNYNLSKDYIELKSFLIVLDDINPDIENNFLLLIKSNKGLFISMSIIHYVQENYPEEYEEAVKKWTVLKYKNEINKKTNAVAQ